MKLPSLASHASALVLLAVACVLSPLADPAPVASPDPEDGEIIEVLGPDRPSRPDSVVRTGGPRNPRKLSLTISALHLAVLFPEVSVEVRPVPYASVTATGGAMWYGDGTNVQELGGQIRYYPAGRHSGFHLGLEGFWGRLHLGEADDDGGALSGLFDHWTLHPYGGGPFAGIKHVRDDGVTFELQIGLQGIRIDPDSQPELFPLINFNFGKSW